MDVRRERIRLRDEALARAQRAHESGVLGESAPTDIVFLTISGAHIYGFPSPDSDLDLRGAHLLPLEQVIGLKTASQTFELFDVIFEDVPLDSVTHDLAKYLRMLVSKNGYVLEQIFSPLVVSDGGSLDELRSLATDSLTRHVVHHYRGFFRNLERDLTGAERPTVKGVLYLYRVVMTGLHLLRTRTVVTDILTLNDDTFGLPFITELVERKMSGGEHGALEPSELDGLLADARTLEQQLEPAADGSGLPDIPPNVEQINDFLVKSRLRTGRGGR